MTSRPAVPFGSRDVNVPYNATRHRGGQTFIDGEEDHLLQPVRRHIPNGPTVHYISVSAYPTNRGKSVYELGLSKHVDLELRHPAPGSGRSPHPAPCPLLPVRHHIPNGPTVHYVSVSAYPTNHGKSVYELGLSKHVDLELRHPAPGSGRSPQPPCAPPAETCDRLAANDPTLTRLETDLCDGDSLRVLDVFKQNTVVKTLVLHEQFGTAPLSLLARLAFAEAITNHPTLEELCFVKFHSLHELVSTLNMAFRLSATLSRFTLKDCLVTPQVNWFLKKLLTDNTISSLAVLGVNDERGQWPLDLSGALRSNKSLTELVLDRLNHGQDRQLVITRDTLRELPLMLRGNKGITKVRLGIQLDAQLVVPIVDSAMSHKSLNSFALNGNAIDDYTAETLGYMLQTSPALRELDASRCTFSMIGFERLINGLKSQDASLETLVLSDTIRGPEQDGASKVLRNMLEVNPNLKSLRSDFIARADATMIYHLLSMNRAGRKILKSPSVPLGLWSDILGRSSSNTDAIFFFLRERHNVIFGRDATPTTGKRKREGWTSWLSSLFSRLGKREDSD